MGRSSAWRCWWIWSVMPLIPRIPNRRPAVPPGPCTPLFAGGEPTLHLPPISGSCRAKLIEPSHNYVLRACAVLRPTGVVANRCSGLCPRGVCSLAGSGGLEKEGSGRVSEADLKYFCTMSWMTHISCLSVWMVQMKVSLSPRGGQGLSVSHCHTVCACRFISGRTGGGTSRSE